MRAGAVTVMTYSVSTLSNGMLQGIGRMNLPVKNAVISLVLHIASLIALMYYTGSGYICCCDIDNSIFIEHVLLKQSVT